MPGKKDEPRLKATTPAQLRSTASQLRKMAISIDKLAGMMDAAKLSTVAMDGHKGLSEGIKAIKKFHAKGLGKIVEA